MQQILEVAIGLVLVIAVVSLVVSASMEMIATVLRLRSKALEQGIARMLDQKLNKQDPTPITGAVLSHPLIQAQSSPKAAQSGKKPSYIDAVTFATALLDTAVQGATLVDKFVSTKDSIDATVKALAADTSAEATALKGAWARSGGSPTALVNLLQTDPGGPGALALVVGAPDAVAARISDLESKRDPAAAQLRSAWTASGGNVAAFVAQLETPELVTRVVEGAHTVDSAIKDIAAAVPFLGRTLEQLWIRAEGDFKIFRHEIEDWYDREMQRVSGWYARWTKWIMVGIGLAIALALNVSVTTIGRSLWTDSTLRSNVVAEANAIIKQNQTTTTATPPATPAPVATNPSATAKCVLPSTTATTIAGSPSTAGATGVAGVTCLQSIDLPIGWTGTAWPGLHPYLALHILGIIMVGVATSFGAPFWFGVLNNLVNLRGGGPQPPQAASQRAPATSPPPS